jgi:hypothetical protein
MGAERISVRRSRRCRRRTPSGRRSAHLQRRSQLPGRFGEVAGQDAEDLYRFGVRYGAVGLVDRLLDAENWCVIDAVQGSFRAAAADLFTEVTPELADLAAAVVMAENERLR